MTCSARPTGGGILVSDYPGNRSCLADPWAVINRPFRPGVSEFDVRCSTRHLTFGIGKHVLCGSLVPSRVLRDKRKGRRPGSQTWRASGLGPSPSNIQHMVPCGASIQGNCWRFLSSRRGHGGHKRAAELHFGHSTSNVHTQHPTFMRLNLNAKAPRREDARRKNQIAIQPWIFPDRSVVLIERTTNAQINPCAFAPLRLCVDGLRCGVGVGPQ